MPANARLGRAVAIKLAARRFSGRVEREARAVAALNHPNICTMPAPTTSVMELVEGRTLAERIVAGPIPEGETLEIARQIAAAHEKGRIRRITCEAIAKNPPQLVIDHCHTIRDCQIPTRDGASDQRIIRFTPAGWIPDSTIRNRARLVAKNMLTTVTHHRPRIEYRIGLRC